MTDAELDQCRHDGALLHSVVSRQVDLRRCGSNWKGCCPLHPDDDPSFITYGNGHFHCFGCGSHGTVFDFIMLRDGVEFRQAVELVEAELGRGTVQPKKPNGHGNGANHGEMWEPIVPAPDDAPPPTEDQLRCDLPKPYAYLDAAGRLLCYVRRFEAKPGKSKQFLPLTFGVLDGKRGWHAKAPATPRALYGLHRLSHAEPDATVLLCEGEKAADAARRMFPDMVCMSWMGGANADGGADLSPLIGYSVILWPDADKVGREVMARIAKRLPQVTITLNTEGLSDGFDAADLEQEGCDDADAWLEDRLRGTEPTPPEPEPDQEENLPGTEPEAKPEAKPLAELTTADLAAMDEIAFGLIKKAKAALLGITPTDLGKARSAEKAKIAKAARDAKDEATKAEKAAEKAAKAREQEAKAKDKADKQAAAEARKQARLAKPLVEGEDDDPLNDWRPPNTPPEITVSPGGRHNAADDGLAAMATANVPFYERGGDLVRVCLLTLKLSTGETVRVPAISTVTRPVLMRALGRCARWQTHNKENDLVAIDPPSDLGEHILGMIGEWPFPPLRGVIATQTMRHDGTLLTKEGYDRATGLVLFRPPPMQPIPDQPTKKDALEALALLNDLLTGFDFADDGEVSRSAAISMLMTPVLRGMMPAAPIHFITKPDAGSGGSYLQDLMAAIAIGKRCPTISLTVNNDEENEKRLSSAARTGQLIIAIDNFTGTLMGNFFCQMIDRPMPQIRVLGTHDMVTIPNNHCIVANGINITIGTDAVRRGVRIELDPNVENPYERTFTRDPVAEVLADRGPAVRAALIIARAYRVAGMPGKLPPRPSFAEWSDNVRSPLVWLKWPDCDESVLVARAADPHTSNLFAVMAAWATDLQVGKGYRVSELITEAGAFVTGARIRPNLWEALSSVAGNTAGHLDPRILSHWLRDHQNRISGGYKLICDTSDKQRPKWQLLEWKSGSG